jgi:Flp pilus assembly protein TadG
MNRRINVAGMKRRVASKSRGQVFVLVSLALTLLFGFSALAVDIGNLWTTRRLMQNAADAAAMAGADEVARNANSATITAAARAAAAQNGFTSGASNTHSSQQVTVAVYNPPVSGPFATNVNAVQVTVSQVQPTFFMRVLGKATVPVTTNAVGLTVSGGSCIYALNPDDSGAVTVGGTGNLNSSCGLYDNSTSGSALTVSGGGVIQAPLVGVVGGTNINGGGSTPPSTGIAAFGDPLAWEPQPAPQTCTSYHMLNISTNTTLNPGLYCGGIKVTGGAVTFNPGLYYINGGGLVLNGGTVNGSSTTFFLTGQNTSNGSPNAYGGVTVNGTATVHLSAPCSASGGSIEGMLFFQDRAMTNGTGSIINGGSNSSFTGALYFPTTNLSYSGTSGANQYTLLVSDMLTINGTTNIGNNYSCLSNGSLIKNAALAQ